jgi:hypothetical protein
MARTNAPRTRLPKGASTLQATGVAVDPTNGHVIAAVTEAGTTILDIDSTFAGAKTFTIKAGTPGANGFPQNAGLGDLVLSLNAQRVLVPLDLERHMQPDGTINIDVQAGATGTVRVYHLPY